MLKYLQSRTGAHISGFDFSQNAIESARLAFPDRSGFRVGIIGEIEYPDQSFDAVISMDTVYFAENLTAFVGQVKKWLKMGGVFLIGYQEGDIMRKTKDSSTTVLAKALEDNGFPYDVQDLTEQTYHLMRHKRKTIEGRKSDFIKEGRESRYDMIWNQTNCAAVPLETYKKENARYLYTARRYGPAMRD